MIEQARQIWSHFFHEHFGIATADALTVARANDERISDWDECDHYKRVIEKLVCGPTRPDFDRVPNCLKNMVRSGLLVPSDPAAVGVIVETRRHEALERVVLNFIQRTRIPVQIFHGPDNRSFILETKIAVHVEKGEVVLAELGEEGMDARKYNAVFLSKPFWHAMAGRRKIVVFQVDSWICEQSDYELDEFLGFDYIGSRWPRLRPVGLIVDGGSGGLSVRDWKMSMDCLNSFPPQQWVGGEDGYFAFHMVLLGGNVATAKDCQKFSTQHFFRDRSLGAHQISLLSKRQQTAFLEYCPEAAFLLT